MGVNDHIKDALEKYCNLDYTPEYALLLRGKWGTGKTYLVKKFVEENNGMQTSLFSNKYLYISLFGVDSKKALHSKFISCLYPTLNSEKGKVVGRFCNAIADKYIGLNLNSLDPDNEILMSLFEKVEGELCNYILIFDDLERCDMPVQNVLGFINRFVEHRGMKVVIIANEEELKNEDSYRRFKEKLIGKTYEVKPDFDSFFECFSENVELDDSDFKAFMKKHTQQITQIFYESSYDNIRIMSQSLHDFRDVFKAIANTEKGQGNQYLANLELMRHFICAFIALSIECKVASLGKSDFLIVPDSDLRVMELSDHQRLKELRVFFNKYEFYKQKDSFLLEMETWKEIIIEGQIAINEISRQLEESIYLMEKKRPDWAKLWYFHDLTSARFDELYKQVKKNLIDLQYSDTAVLFHIVGMFIYFDQKELLPDGEESVVNWFPGVLKKLKDRKILKGTRPLYEISDAYGLGFMGNGIKEAAKFKRMIQAAWEETVDNKRPEEANDIMTKMKADLRGTLPLLYLNDSECSPKYLYFPILKHIDEDEFIGLINMISSYDIYSVGEMFKKRYLHSDAYTLAEELEWLQSLSTKLEAYEGDRIKRYNFQQHLLPAINEAIGKLQESIDNNEVSKGQ